MSEHSAERLRHAAVIARRTLAVIHGEGVRLPDGAVLDLWHLIAEAERTSAELAPALAPASPCIWAVEDPACGTTVPAGLVIRLPGERLARFRFERVIGEIGADGRAAIRAPPVPA